MTPEELQDEVATEEQIPGDADDGTQGELPLSDQAEEETEGVDEEESERGYLRQADYTKKTMALADERRAFEEQKRKLEEQSRKWEMFETDPNYRAAILAQAQAVEGNGTRKPEPATEIDTSKYDPNDIAMVKALVEKAIAESVQPQLQQGYSILSQMQKKEVANDWARLQKEFPESAQYKEKIISFLQANPGVTNLETAMFAVSGRDLISKRQLLHNQKENQEKKAARTIPKGVSSAAVSPKPKSLRQIAEDVFNGG